jgi:hypothetical protein
VLFLSQYLLGFTTLTIVIAHLVLAVVINWLCQNSISESWGFGLGPLPGLSLGPRTGPPSFNCPAIAAGVSKC